MLQSSTPVRYRDFYFRLIAAVCGALLATEFGGTDGIFTRLMSKWFYIEFFASLLIAYLLIEAIYRITVFLDRYYDWVEHPLLRVGLQLIMGVGIPGLMDFFLAAMYFRIYGMSILNDTNYVVYALPFILMMILLFNVYYVCHYFYLKARRVSKVNTSEGIESIPTGKEILTVHHGPKSIPLPVQQISYIYRDGEYNYLQTFGEEHYLIPQSLDQLQEVLNPQQFFRVNRQMILNLKACLNYQPAKFGKLELTLTPAHAKKVIVSQGKARHFKEWIER